MRTRRSQAVLCIVLFLLGPGLAGCGFEVASASPRGSAPLGSAPTALPSTGALDTRCTDSSGDTAGIDVTNIAMVSQDDQLVVAFAFTSLVPTEGAVILTIEAHSQDGKVQRHLGIQVLNGKPVASFVATSPSSEPTRLYDAVHVADGEVHAAFPVEAVKALGPKWNWFAMVGGLDSVDDFCPGGAGATLDSIRSVSVG
jgi:hypothetical protein